MFCKQCGKPIKEGLKFCTYCGSPIDQAANGIKEGDETSDIMLERAEEPSASAAKQAVQNKKKHAAYKGLWIVSAVLLAAALGTGGYLFYNINQINGQTEVFSQKVTAFKEVLEDYDLEDKEEYEDLVEACKEARSDKAVKLYDALEADMKAAQKDAKALYEYLQTVPQMKANYEANWQSALATNEEAASYNELMLALETAVVHKEKADVEKACKAIEILEAKVSERKAVDANTANTPPVNVYLYQEDGSSALQSPSSTPVQNSNNSPKTYVYNDFMFYDSDSRYLSQSELVGLSQWELLIARNEIYARKGRRFAKQKLQDYFNSQYWYNGTIAASDFKDSMLNQYEKANVDLIKDYEKSMGYIS